MSPKLPAYQLAFITRHTDMSDFLLPKYCQGSTNQLKHKTTKCSSPNSPPSSQKMAFSCFHGQLQTNVDPIGVMRRRTKDTRLWDLLWQSHHLFASAKKKGWILWPPAWSRAPCLLPDSKVTSEGVAEPLIHWVKSVQLIKSLSPVSVPIIPNILTILVFGDPIPAVIISSEFRHSVELSIAHYSMTDSMKGGPNLIRNLFLQCQKGVTNSNFQQLQLLYPRDQLFFSRLLRWKTKAIADPNTWLQCYPLNGSIHVCILSCSMTLYV